jgi:hypothetical protein
MKHTMHDAKMEVVFKIDKVIKILLIKYEMKDNQNKVKHGLRDVVKLVETIIKML